MVDGMKNKKWSVLESPSSVSELGEFRTIYDSNLVFACSKDSLKTTYDWYVKCNKSIKLIAHINKMANNKSHKCTCP